LERDYEINGHRSLRTVRFRLHNLRKGFPWQRAIDVTTASVEAYKHARLKEGAAHATINRELAALKRAFHLAREQGRVTRVPIIKLLTEDNVRQGYVDRPVWATIAANLPDDGLRDFARYVYRTGWRSGEAKTLEWSQVNRTAKEITLLREHSKNKRPRVIGYAGELEEIIERRWARRTYTTPDGQAHVSPFVFHREGHPIRDFRASWRKACIAAGVPGLHVHDLRRSAVRNFEKDGVSQAVAMSITGHETASIYRRYRITDPSDSRAAFTKGDATTPVTPAEGNVIPLPKRHQQG
jgi:integrase